ncbi:L,D-transpeptidase [Actinomadura flavalba]|uniref:L,D-transpeptidase n=1 Tax=Actinomadura flavalba TaxID=1120938 RepID=UPI0003604756|nr:L,D-transpeptidase [Actinomadura flavalba]
MTHHPRARLALAALLPLLLAACGSGAESGADAAPSPGSPGPARAEPGETPDATTFTKVPGAPLDSGDDADGTVLHPSKPQPVLDKPGGTVIATLPARQLGGPTWVPVVETSGDWMRVLLPSRPNGATGWITGRADGLRTARSPYTVKVDVARRTLTVRRSGRPAGTWKVAVGAAATPTPAGRTFVMAQLKPSKPQPSPLIIPLGAHSATLDTFGGGPGTVAFHGWPDASAFGRAVSHGCVRVPADALAALAKVPLGTLVHITG